MLFRHRVKHANKITHAEAGMVTISYILATGLSLLIVTWCILFIVNAYTRAVIRDASIKASRSGVASFNLTKNSEYAAGICEEKFNKEINNGLPESTISNIDGKCTFSDGQITLHVSGSLQNISGVLSPFQLDESTSRNVDLKTN